MNDLAEPSADHPATADVNLGALRDPIPDPVPDVNVWALDRPAPAPEVDGDALRRTPKLPDPPPSRRRQLLVGLVAFVLIAVIGGGGWWNRQVTGDPDLVFNAALNVYRDGAFTDRHGISRDDNPWFDDVEETRVIFEPNSPLFAMIGLYNGGGHDVRIEGFRPARLFYWGFERVSLATGPDGSWDGNWIPFEPFTLRQGDTRMIRLEFRTADCVPAAEFDSASVLRVIRVRYHILGFTRTAEVPFEDEAIALQAPQDCPGPIVD